MKWRYFKEGLFFGSCGSRPSSSPAAPGRSSLLYLLSTVIGAITWDFLTLAPTDSMTKGGIMPAIVGTFYLTVGAIAVALPLGVMSAIYLTEYAKQGPCHPDHPHRGELSGRRALRRLRALRPRLLRRLSAVRLQHPLGLADARDPDPPDDHRGRGGGPQGGAPDLPGGLPGPGRLQMAHHLPDRPAHRPCPAS